MFADDTSVVYSTFNESTGTLTYYYDANRASRGGKTELYNLETVRFTGYHDQVKKAIIDPSMKNAPLTWTLSMFYGGTEENSLTNMTTIEGLKNLNTAKVTIMDAMFYRCSALTSLDLSSFNTSNVTDMYSMFAGCSGLTSLDLSSFNTSNVTDMRYMFAGCSGLTSLDLSSFNTSNVTDMSYMFYLCSAMTTMYCGDDWSTNATLTNCDKMFKDCTKLVGSEGTTYDNSFTDKTYARLDGGLSAPGYFSVKSKPKKVYTVYDETTQTLTFCYGNNYKLSNPYYEVYDPVSAPYAVRFTGYHDKVKKAVIDPSMKEAPLTSMSKMFYGGYMGKSYNLSAMTTIEGLENLNTSNVTDMYSMFGACSALTSLNLSTFNTENVTNMSSMFEYCSSLKTLDISSFDIGMVTTMTGMFNGCSELTTIYCSNYWSRTTATSSSMFTGCDKLKGGKGTIYDNSKVDANYARPDSGTENPGYFTATPHVYTEFNEETGTMTYYYDNQRDTRSGVTEVYNPVGNPKAVRFTGYHDQVKKAVIDPSMKNAGLTSMTRMFYGGFNMGTDARQSLSAMTEIEGMEYLNTAEVTNMSEMFDGCESLTSIDLRTFSIAKVDNLASMFSNCKELTTIYCNDDWSSSWASSMGLFYNCKKLKGGKGTEYIYKDIDIGSDIVYARPDGLGGEPGYFTVMGDVDGNGKATIADVEAIASYIMGNPPAGFNEALADINHDGVINVADLVLMISMMK